MWYVIAALTVSFLLIAASMGQFPGLFDGALHMFADKGGNGTESYTELRVVSVGWNGISPVSNLKNDGNIYDMDGKSIQTDKTNNRGLELFIFNDKDQLEYHRVFDTYGSTQNAADMANKIKNTTDKSKLIVVVASDSITEAGAKRHLANGLEEAMYSIGASSDIYAKLDNRDPYVLVGKPKLGKNNGHERTARPDQAIDFNMSLSGGWSKIFDKPDVANIDKDNLFPSMMNVRSYGAAHRGWLKNNTPTSFETNAWAMSIIEKDWVSTTIEPNTQYKIEYTIKLLSKPTNNIRSQSVGGMNLYRTAAEGDPWGPSVYFGGITVAQYKKLAVGDTVYVSDFFITPEDVDDRELLLYTAAEVEGGTAPVAEMCFSNIRLIKVNND